MRNFNLDNKSKNRFGSSGRNFTDRDSRRFLKHSAVCDECGKECQVPFKPTSGKPIYCDECFEKKGRRNSNRPGRRDSYRHNYGERGLRRFGQNGISDQSATKLIEKIETLNSKLDKIISLLSSAGEKEGLQKRKKRSKKEKNKKTKSIKLNKLTK